MGAKKNYENYMGNPALPISKETETTYGGGKLGKAPTQKTPKAPDPFMLIEEQTKANRPDEVGPLGSVRFRKDPNTGYWERTQEFSPELQGLYNQRIGMVGEDVPLPDMPSDESFGQEGERLERATLDKYRMQLDPRFQQEESQLISNLANKGIMQGSEAYTKALDDFSRRKNTAYQAASNEAIGAGRQEQGRLFGQGIQSRQLGFNQALGRRSQLYNELASLIGTQQIGRPGEIDVMGPFSQQYQGQLASVNSANQNAAQRNAQTTSAATTVAAALLAAFSDRRLKADIEKVGKLPSGINLYTYRYVWDDRYRVGVMADEVEKVYPEAVGEMYGFKTVDYSRIH